MSLATDLERLQRRLAATWPGVEVYLAPEDGSSTAFSLDLITILDVDRRRARIGTKVMAEILAFADERRLTIWLTPAHRWQIDWYRGMGFVPHKGDMRRAPRPINEEGASWSRSHKQ